MAEPTTFLNVELGERSYPIEIGCGRLERLGERLRPLVSARRALVVSDDRVAPHYGETALASLRAAGFEAALHVVPAGEETKCLDALSGIYDHLVAMRFSRQDAVAALGGGVVGDLAGFAAATILRGVDFVQIPTSLVAMVDSSVGGKTGINHPRGKNLIGSFWQPRMVFVDTALLATLERRELLSGMGEVIKHGVIRDPAYFDFIESNLAGILALDGAAMGRVVEGSCRIKAGVVAADERETTGVRAILNFGHTLGHAVETVAGYGVVRHGEAVAIGMEAAGRLAVRRGLWPQTDHDRMSRLIERTSLPRRVPQGLSREALLDAMRLDKKVRDGRVRFVLPTRIGEVRLVNDVTAAEIEAVIDEMS